MSLGEPQFIFFLKMTKNWSSIKLYFSHIYFDLKHLCHVLCSWSVPWIIIIFFNKRVSSMLSVSVILIGFVMKSKHIEKNIMYDEMNVSHIRTKFPIDVSYVRTYVLVSDTYDVFYFPCIFLCRDWFLFLSTHFLLPIRRQKISSFQTDQWRRKSKLPYGIVTNIFLHTYGT